MCEDNAQEISCCSTLNEKDSIASCCPEKDLPTSASGCCSGPNPSVVETACCTTPKAHASSCCAPAPSQEKMPFSQRVKLAFIEAWGQFKQVFPYLLLGVSLGAMVYGFVPSDFIAKYASGDSILAVPIAAVIGIPLYVRVEALIALSAVLVGKGMGLGAVMALIIGGGGASLTEVILLKSMFRTPMIVAFLTVILGMAIVAGYIFQFAL